jgi:O-succinylbenzoic acid--CoA ligase
VHDLVAIDLPAGDAFVDALQRAWERGDAVLPLDQRLTAERRAAFAATLAASVVVDADGEHRLTEGRPVEPGDAVVVATSGTTGAPKGVVLTHDSVLAAAAASSRRLGVDPTRHRWLACLPLCHVGGLGVVIRSLLTGTELIVLAGFDAEAVQAAGGPDVLVSLVPTALRRVHASGFHTVLLGGSAPPPDLPPNVVTTYGMTETAGGVVYDGVPLEGTEVKVDPATSEIMLRGPTLLRSYRDGSNPVEPGGWLRTGDAGHMDPDGRLHVDGRLAEMIVTGGENVWPAAVEAALLAHPKVGAAAVAGRPDPEWGERVVAWVVPSDAARPPALEELREAVADSVAPWAAPRELVVVEELPRSAIGKVRRAALPG